MLVSRRKIISFLSGLLGASLAPLSAMSSEPIITGKNLVVGNSISINPKSNFYLKSDVHKKHVLKHALHILGLGFKKYDEDNGTHSYEQAQAVINASKESWAQYIALVASTCGEKDWINIYVSVNLTQRTSESGIRIEVPNVS